MNGVMNGLDTRNVSGSLNDTNAAPLDVICNRSFAKSSGSQCRNFRLMHPVIVGRDIHDGSSQESLIGGVSGVVKTSQSVEEIIPLMLSQPHKWIVLRRFLPSL